MRLRSLLFVPGDRPERMEKALGLGADALILDLEDAVAPARKDEARAAVSAFLATHAGQAAPAGLSPFDQLPGGRPLQARSAQGAGPALFVRINPLDSGMTGSDLDAAAGAYGLVLPKSEGAGSLFELDRLLEKRDDRTTTVIPIATETAAAMFTLGNYGGVSERLIGLTWGAEDLPAAIGATSAREDDGSYTAPYQLARALTLFGAHAAGVAAIETVFPAFKDEAGLAAYAARGRRDGFTGMMAIHPAQVPVINAAFTPSAEEIAHARAVIAAFAASPDAGALSLDGKMIDRPHLVQAERIVAQADAAS